MSDQGETYRTRGTGLNWLPCLWCGYEPQGAQPDAAAFVPDEATGRRIVGLFEAEGLTASVDMRRAKEGRFQVKVGACEAHKDLLDVLVAYTMHTGDIYPLDIERLRRVATEIDRVLAIRWTRLAEQPPVPSPASSPSGPSRHGHGT